MSRRYKHTGVQGGELYDTPHDTEPSEPNGATTATADAPAQTRKPRRKDVIPENETKEQRFARLAPRRVSRALHVLKTVKQLSNRSNYAYSDDQRNAVCAAVIEATDELVKSFQNASKVALGFVLPMT